MSQESAGLERFIQAQQDVYEQALAELKSGRKRSHWMWFIFPQIAGLGFSSTSRFYAIRDISEAQEYLAHPLLGERLRQCSRALLAQSASASTIFGQPDDLKLCSSMTLFAVTDADNLLFNKVLYQFFAGRQDNRTLELLA